VAPADTKRQASGQLVLGNRKWDDLGRPGSQRLGSRLLACFRPLLSCAHRSGST